MSGSSEHLELSSLPPRTQNCLSWSEDGGLAVAANETVYILIPDRSQRNQDNRFRTLEPWHRIRLPVDSFTEAEWPHITMGSMASFSVGMEQSAVGVVSLAWSPAGLGERGRCVLAVLTSNYVLSIWGPGSNSSLISGWRRLLVVNHCFDTGWSDISAISWLPVVDTGSLNTEKGERHPARAPRDWVHPLLAISRDGLLTLFRIFAAKGDSLSAADLASTAHQQQTSEAASNNGTRHLLMLQTEIQDSINTELRVLCSRWSQWTGSKRTLSGDSLSCFHEALGLSASYSKDRGSFSITNVETLHATFRKTMKLIQPSTWDGPANVHCTKIGGTTIDANLLLVSGHCLSLKFFRQAHSTQTKGQKLKIDLLSGESRLLSQFQKLTDEYSQEHNLGGRVQIFVWGLSSWQDYIVACITIHPTHLLQYMMQSTSKLYVVFSHRALEPGWPGKQKHPLDPMDAFPLGVPAPSKEDLAAHEGGVIWPPILKQSTVSPVLDLHCNAQLIFVNIIARFQRTLSNPHPSKAGKSSKALASQLKHLASTDSAFKALITRLSTAATPTSLPEFVNTWISQHHTAELSSRRTKPRILEYCAISGCHAPVLWRSGAETSCADGHPHVRCALTSLALVNPFVLKRCEECGRKYLDEQALELFYEDTRKSHVADETLPGIRGAGGGEAGHTEADGAEAGGAEDGDAEADGAEAGDAEDGVAWMLHEAVLCVYCGGKFVRDVPLPRRDMA